MSPHINLKHLKSLTDDVGIIQHTKYDIPDRKNGYALDDQARALIVAIYLKENKLARTYFSYLYHSQNEEGLYQTFMNYERRFTNVNSLNIDVRISDAFALAFWALSIVVKERKGNGIDKLAEVMLDKSYKHLMENQSLRVSAYTVIGLANIENKEKLKEAVKIILSSWESSKSSNWQWFENTITYANAIIPYSLMCAYQKLKEPELLESAIASLNFLEKASRIGKYPAPIGTWGWYPKGGNRALFDQQCIDTAFMVMAHNKLYKITKDTKHQKLAGDWFQWFTGNNLHQKSLYKNHSGKVYDGLTYKNVNQNAGAESVLVYLMAALSMLGKL